MAFVDVIDLAGYLGADAADLGWLGEFAVRTAEEAVKGVLDQQLGYAEDDTVLMNGSGTSALLLPQLPVIDVSDVTESGSSLTEETDYVVGEHGIL